MVDWQYTGHLMNWFQFPSDLPPGVKEPQGFAKSRVLVYGDKSKVLSLTVLIQAQVSKNSVNSKSALISWLAQDSIPVMLPTLRWSQMQAVRLIDRQMFPLFVFF